MHTTNFFPKQMAVYIYQSPHSDYVTRTVKGSNHCAEFVHILVTKWVFS